jgi:hypothetical protein
VPTASIPHVTVADRRFRGKVPVVRVHRVQLGPGSTTHCFGLPVTTRVRTVVDLLRTEKYSSARDLRDRALQLGWIDERSLDRSISEQPGRTGNAQLRCIDVGFPELRIAIEVDGKSTHGDWSDRFDDDRERQNDLIAAGWHILRFTWRHLQDPAYVISRIMQLAAA